MSLVHEIFNGMVLIIWPYNVCTPLIDNGGGDWRHRRDLHKFILGILNYSLKAFIHLKLELLKQFPVLNDRTYLCL